MIPYVELREARLGPVTLHVFGALVFIAAMVGKSIIQHRSQREGLNRTTASSLFWWMLASGFAGAHLLKVLVERFSFAIANPIEFVKLWDGLYSFGGLLGGISGVVVYSRSRRLPARDRCRDLQQTAIETKR